MAVVSNDDWTLDRRGKIAQDRHQKKVKDAIKHNLMDIVTQRDLIMSNGKDTIRIPIRSLDEPRIVYGSNKKQDQGGSQGNSAGNGPGNQDGEHVYEVDVQFEAVVQELFDGFELPNTHPTQPVEDDEDIEFTDLRKTGIRANLDRKRTFREAMKRSIVSGKKFVITKDDMRFKTWEEKDKPDINAVIIAMMDVSGSMGEQEKFLSRSLFFWVEQFLKTKYKAVEFRFVIHHTSAVEVKRDEFFTTRESGGTIISSALELGLHLMDTEYPLDQWNVYPIYVGDGDNLTSDNQRTIELLNKMANQSSMTAYVEVGQYVRSRTTLLRFIEEQLEKVKAVSVPDKEEIIKALEILFKKETAV